LLQLVLFLYFLVGSVLLCSGCVCSSLGGRGRVGSDLLDMVLLQHRNDWKDIAEFAANFRRQKAA